MMTVAQRVGKLAEVRYVPPLTMDELVHFMADVRALVERAPIPLVFCCDWRQVESFDTTFADTIVWIMRRDNPRIAGNGVVVRSERLYVQVEHILKDANNPRRAVFRDVPSLNAWLDPQLSPAERRRRDEFLAEGVPPGAHEPA